jgi:hypothetical protein
MLNNVVGLLGGALPEVGDYESIQTYTLTGNQTSVTFSSIPSTYKHLQVRLTAKTDRALNRDTALLTFNSDTGTNYVAHALFGDGSTAQAQYQAAAQSIALYRIAGNSSATDIFGALIIDILDYTNTNKNTTVRALGGVDLNGAGEIWLNSGLWLNTAAISTLKLAPGNATNFMQYSSFALYGIK